MTEIIPLNIIGFNHSDTIFVSRKLTQPEKNYIFDIVKSHGKQNQYNDEFIPIIKTKIKTYLESIDTYIEMSNIDYSFTLR